MSELQRKWNEGASQREEQRAARAQVSPARRAAGGLAGLGWLLLVVAIVLAVVALIGFVLWGVVASGAWKPLVGFLIAAVVIAAISIGIRR